MLNERNTLLEDDGIEEEILVEEECSVAQAVWGDIQGNIENQTDLQNALDAKQDSLTEAQLNAVNSGITSEKVTTYDGYADQIASKADQSALNAESIARGEADTALGTRIDNEALARQSADNGLQSQIDAITSKSDVVDVVANYAALQAYDTSTLGNNDVVKVLDDETHEDALTYYRWSTTTQTWSYIGQEAPYYSKGQMDTKLAEKQDKLTAGANIQIQNGTISATDTKYTNGNGLNLNGTEFSANTDVLATKEDLEGYYTKPETDNLLAPKLEAEVVTELPTTGAEGKLYLTPKAHTTQTATGNPITATVAEDAGTIESFQLDGDTFQQSYTGKNLIAITRTAETKNGVTCTWNGASFTLDGTSTASTDFYGRGWWGATSDPIALPAGTYTISLRKSDGSLATDADFSVDCYYGTTHIIGIYRGNYGTGFYAKTFDSDTQYSVFYISLGSGKTYNNEKFYIQLEKSESPTSYEPYVGGVPVPNPDYPQPIQTVTGTQTISINGTNYPISLGSIELCKLGDYQDYIWKDGDEWKVHKATGSKVFDGSADENWTRYTGNGSYWGFYIAIPDVLVASPSFSNIGQNSPDTSSWSGGKNTYRISSINNLTFALVEKNGSLMSLDEWQSFLAEENMLVKLALATPTDTTITDQTLIAQLEAIRTAMLQNGTNTVTNTATGSNLAGDMEIGYYGFAPRNRYDKWLWLDINNEYEQIGS